MFKKFRPALDTEDAPTIVTVFTAAMIRQINFKMSAIAEKQGQPEIFSKIQPHLNRHIIENIICVIFGRILVRMTATSEEAKRLDIPIPSSPKLLPDSLRIRKVKEIFLSWAVDDNGLTYTVENPEEPSVWKHAIQVGLLFSAGEGLWLEAQLREELYRLFQSAGFQHASIDKLVAPYTRDLDRTIDRLCVKANELWAEVPMELRDDSKQHLASIAAQVIKDLNQERGYSLFFKE